MRLTLRTLLAWLDDTLKPTQVREIGHQVAESSFAQELAERIHRVTRQRRLTVPSSSGPDATDPNLVASYLDNELDPEAVAEYEKKCLTSDVNLAEAASVHQILSLLGQKVKVPAEAKLRMHQLVKGREATRARPAATKAAPAREPVTRPIPEWVVPEAPKAPLVQRVGVVAGCLALITLASLSAWRSLSGPTLDYTPGPGPLLAATGADHAAPAQANERAEPEKGAMATASEKDQAHVADTATPDGSGPIAATVPAAATGETNPAPAPTPPGEPAATKSAMAADTSSTRDIRPASTALTKGAAGAVELPEGVVLRFNSDQKVWERLTSASSLARGDRILCLAPFQAKLELNKTKLVLEGDTEIRVAAQAAAQPPALELVHGRVRVQQPGSTTLELLIVSRKLSVAAADDSTLALERNPLRDYAVPNVAPPPLFVYCTHGEISVTVGKEHQSLKPSDAIALDATSPIQRSKQDAPAWASDAELPAHELQIRDQFMRVFKDGRPVATDAVAATDDSSPDIKRLAIQALKSLAEISYLVPVLNANDAFARRRAIRELRAYRALGPIEGGRVRDQLLEVFGADNAPIVEKLLVGFGADEASSPRLFKLLVETLSPEQSAVGVRELALENLKRLTGRDDLGYSADNPDDKGLKAWRDLEAQGKLRATNARGKAG
jgi:hypothetical protein